MAVPEWGDFKVMLALSQGGSIAGAARILGVDSSTISRRLAAMEEVVGAVLVTRGGRDFQLTPEGRSAVAAAEKIRVAVETATAEIRAAKQEIEGVIKISCVGSVFHMFVPMLDGLRENYPKLLVDLNDADHLVSLAKGEADIAIRMVRPTEPDLIVRKAFEFGWLVVASKTYVETHGLPARPEDLRKHHLILYGEDRLHHPGFKWLEQFHDKNGKATRVSNTSVAVRSIVAGVGIGVLPIFEIGNELGLVRVFPDPVLFHTAWLAYHESSRNTARVRVVIDALVEFLDTRADFLAGRTSVG